MGSIPGAELAQSISMSKTAPTTTTEVIPFSETFYHESRENLASVTLAQWGAFSYSTPDGDYCSAIQSVWPDWDCRDAETLAISGQNIGNVCYGGCYLEFEKYTLELDLVYKYKFEYSGSVTFDTTTSWSDNGQPQTTVTLTDSTENTVVSVKAYLDLSIKRYFDGPNTGDMFLRNIIINKIFPYLSPTDIDGGGNGFTVGYGNSNYNFYAWDDYVQFSSLYGEDGGLGEEKELNGYVGLATVELLGVVAKYCESKGLYQCSKPLAALNYFLHLDFGLYLDLEVRLWNNAQLFLGMMSPSAIGSTYNSEGIRSAYNCRLPSSGTMSGSSSYQSCMKGVSGSDDDLYGRLGFRHHVETKESYSISLVLHAGEGYWASTIWNLIMSQSSYQWQLSRDWYPTYSSDTHYTMTTSSSYIAKAPEPAPPNSAPSILISDSSGSTSNIIATVGEQVQLSVSTQDSDGDSLNGLISWGDETVTNGLQNTLTHTYYSAGQYEVAGYASDGIATTYSNSINVVVTPQTTALQSLSINADQLMITEGEIVTFTMSSSNPGANFQFVFSDGINNPETISSSTGELATTQRQINYLIPGDYTPNIAAYDQNWNLIGYEEVELTVLPDFGNGSIDPSLFEIIGNEILVVIDDAGEELSTINKSDYWDERIVSSSNSQAALIQALNQVSQIRDVDLDYFTVGDSNLDGIIDLQNANGPGLSILRHYSTVIWTTGKDYSPLSERDESVLRTYTESGGALIFFSQDYLFGAGQNQNQWSSGTFANDILGVGSSLQDSGEPGNWGELITSDGDGIYNTEYLPFAGLGSIQLAALQSDMYQDHISKDMEYQYLPEWHNFESSTIHGSKSDYATQNGTTYGQGTVGWRTWSYWQRDCSTNSPWSPTGSCSAKTAPATHNNMKQLLADVPSSSEMTTIQFDLKVSSEPTYDYLSFSVDGQEIQRWSGNVGWTQFSHTLSPGGHSLEWAYVKDGSDSSGSDAAWIDNVYLCCDTGVYETGRTLEVLSDGEYNYGLVTMLEDGGRVAFMSFDPVQVVNSYDLETMLLQLIDWAENDWTFASSADANTIPVGVNGAHSAPSYSGGESWFNVRLFEGQRIGIETALGNPDLTEFDISELSVYDEDGISVLGVSNTSDEWYIEYTAEKTGIYQVLVDIDNVGSTVSYEPWYTFSIEHLEDQNLLDNSLDNLVNLTIDGDTYHDALAPLGWNDFNYENEYSTSGYYIGNLNANEYYDLGITSTDTYQYHDVGYVFIDYDLAKRLYRQETNGMNDNDGDGVADDLDLDDDDDGVADEFDPSPFDRDDDGIDDKDDDDDDGNGVNDTEEVELEYGEFTLLAGQEFSGIISFDQDVELAIVFANTEVGSHPLVSTFGYDISVGTLPPTDVSESGLYHLNENLEESFWVSGIIDTSDNFTVDLPWDEGMQITFQSQDVIFENSTHAWINCSSEGSERKIDLGQYTVIDIQCDEPYSVVTISIVTNMNLVEYSLFYERSQTHLSVINEKPIFGINQVANGDDLWNLESVGPGQLVEFYGAEGGSISFYDLQSQHIQTNFLVNSGIVDTTDTDLDGYSDISEQFCQSDYLDALSVPNDSDGDGVCDIHDDYPFDSAIGMMPSLIEISVPSNANSFSITEAGYYGFMVFEPNVQSVSISIPEPVVIGGTLNFEVIATQQKNFDSPQYVDRIDNMFNIFSPSLEFTVLSHQTIVDVNVSTESESGSMQMYVTNLTASLSIDSVDLGIGTHILSVAVNSSWTGIKNYDITLVVNDYPNTAPQISGVEYLEINTNESISWFYNASDSDADTLSFELLNGPSDAILEQIGNNSDGLTSIKITWNPVNQGAYNFVIEVSDGTDSTQITTIIDVIESITSEIGGCMDEDVINFDPAATITDGICEYDDVIDDDNEVTDDDKNDEKDDEKDDENIIDPDKNQSTSESDSDEYDSTIVTIGTIGTLMLLLVALSIMMVRRRRGTEMPFDHEISPIGQWDNSQSMNTVPMPGVMPALAPVLAVPDSVSNVPQVGHYHAPPVISEPAVPNRVNSYLDLVGGGGYSTDERGTIYTDPSGYEWVQLADDSFVRLN